MLLRSGQLASINTCRYQEEINAVTIYNNFLVWYVVVKEREIKSNSSSTTYFYLIFSLKLMIDMHFK